jgi:hypothetical protein
LKVLRSIEDSFSDAQTRLSRLLFRIEVKV